MADRFSSDYNQCWATLGGSPRLRLEKTGDEFILRRPQGVYTGKLRPRSIRVIREADKARTDTKTPGTFRVMKYRPKETMMKSPLRSSLTIEDLKKEVEDLGRDIEEGFASLFIGIEQARGTV